MTASLYTCPSPRHTLATPPKCLTATITGNAPFSVRGFQAFLPGIFILLLAHQSCIYTAIYPHRLDIHRSNTTFPYPLPVSDLVIPSAYLERNIFSGPEGPYMPPWVPQWIINPDHSSTVETRKSPISITNCDRIATESLFLRRAEWSSH